LTIRQLVDENAVGVHVRWNAIGACPQGVFDLALVNATIGADDQCQIFYVAYALAMRFAGASVKQKVRSPLVVL
jgi:hypothetical protein